jgi:signal transduction histidine kinase/ActR/RegA family two-component response regulator
MRTVRRLPLARRLQVVTLVVCMTVLVVAYLGLGGYEILDERRGVASVLTILGDVVAENSTAALAFADESAARNVLGTLAAEPHVVAAALYDAEGQLLAAYERGGERATLPAAPLADGHRFEEGGLVVSRPVLLRNERIGSLYLRSDLGGLRDRLAVFGTVAFASLVAAVALSWLLGGRLQRLILVPILNLVSTVRRVGESGDVSLRAEVHGDDEIGRLTVAFNDMLGRIQEHETRLGAANDALRSEIAERVTADRKVLAQLASLELLNRITRASAERADPESICRVTVESLRDDLPADFACIALHDPGDRSLSVCALAQGEGAASGVAVGARLSTEDTALARGLNGDLIHEPDAAGMNGDLGRILEAAGLRALVVAPLRFESNVFGILITARGASSSFTSDECQFLRQLSEHVALSVHQAQLYSALQQAYEDLRQTQQAVMQQERLRSLGEMASGIAHDINNCLAPIMIYTELLPEQVPQLDPKVREYLELVRRSIRDVAETIARLREFYTPRKPQLALFDVDVHRLFEEVSELTRARWSSMPLEQGVVIRLEVDAPSEGIRVLGVESELREALTNLVFNAVDALPHGGTVRLAARVERGLSLSGGGTQQGRVVVEVVDDGVGMDEPTRRQCLEPFFTTKGERGTGLGLAMVYGILQRHNGDIEIDSAPGKGTTIRLLLPEPSGPGGVAEQAASQRPVGRLRVLVVDDDPIVLRAVIRVLESDGHVVQPANGGREGVEAFRAALEGGQAFSAVITDLGMPHVDGRRLASEIKALSSATPIILLTGWGQRVTAEGVTVPNVDRVVSKPPKLADLRAALASVCQEGLRGPGA